MILSQFNYTAPRHLDDAIKILKENENSRLLAGGQSLLVDLKRDRLSAGLLVDLQHIPDLRGIHLIDGGLQIGAFTSLSQLAASDEVRNHYQVLAESAESVGDLQTRNLSTLGGSLACNDPSGDLAAAVLVLNGVIQVAGSRGRHSIPAREFFLGPFKTALSPTEVITSIFFPTQAGEVSSVYEKFKNPANGYAVCGVAARMFSNNHGYDYQLAVTGALEYPCLLPALHSETAKKIPTDGNIDSAISRIELPLAARDDLYASGEYRTQLVKILVKRAIRRAADQIGVNSFSAS